ncbi:MAG: hypothetical protein MUE73_12285 [Planctomycetes bacterium]|jgi:hypothetical protein|nr:hypothetical protein [Planctomycetota bacterium]
MKRTALALCLLLPACGDAGTPGPTPEATFETVRKAVADRRWGTVFDLLAGKELERFKRQLDADRSMNEEQRNELLEELGLSARELDAISPRDYYIRFTEVRSRAKPELTDRIAKAGIDEVKVDGERAVITYRTGEKSREMELARREGLWYVVRW